MRIWAIDLKGRLGIVPLRDEKEMRAPQKKERAGYYYTYPCMITQKVVAKVPASCGTSSAHIGPQQNIVYPDLLYMAVADISNDR